jgi:hypothetical protein
MHFELAQALKDAGFHQSGNGTRVAPPDKIVVRRDDFAYVPTLEELIVACGADIDFALTSEEYGQWDAYDYLLMESGHGETPIEAVANLWLALNWIKNGGRKRLRPPSP